MKKIIFCICMATTMLCASQPNPAKIAKLSKKGQKIVKLLCTQADLPAPKENIAKTINTIKQSKACKKLSKAKMEAVAYFVKYGSTKVNTQHLHVPHGAKCPVCGMFVSKYPKWAGLMVVDEKRYYFDGVKDMMKFYIFDVDFPYDRSHISKMSVTDFYTLGRVEASDAWYVLGSDVYGPMGNELIPFATQKEAEDFGHEHGAKRIVRFGEITAKMVMALDGIEFDG